MQNVFVFGAMTVLFSFATIAAWAEETKTAPPPAKASDEVAAIQKVEKVMVEKFDKTPQLDYPWGWIRWMVTSKQEPDAEMTFGIVYIKPFQMNPLHMHPNCTEYLHVLEGSCEHLVGDKWVKLKVGDVARIPKAVQHMARTNHEGLRAVIVYDSGDRQFIQLGEGKED